MSIVGKQAILQTIVQDTFTRERVGPAPVDLTLASTFRVYRKVHQVTEVRENIDYRAFIDKMEVPDGKHRLELRVRL
jgi:dCTP deaminase